MTLLQFWQSLEGGWKFGIIFILFTALGSLIKVKPLEINLLQYIIRGIGNALNHDLLEEVKTIKKSQKQLETDFKQHQEHDKKKEALDHRLCILRFAREILVDQKHTKEDFIEILDIIDSYNKYCASHPDFPNSRAVFACKLIQNNYQERLEKADFLAEEYRCQLVQNT